MSPSTPPSAGPEFVLTLDCPDRPGIVHAVASFLVRSSANILESQQFDDRTEGRFFMRVLVELVDARVSLEELRGGFSAVAHTWGMTWQMFPADEPFRTLIMVSRSGHCLNDLLFRWKTGALNIDVPAIVSNHHDAEPLAATYGVPFHYLPVSPHTKPEAEAKLLSLVDELGIHLVVLARYMQVLSDETCQALAGRAINIHHSFLPGFKGARPYHQAYARGVKQIGATAHYVTADLDEGPIIEQDVERVTHAMQPDDLVQAGRDIEARVLARAVRWHAQSRVLINGARTVVFR